MNLQLDTEDSNAVEALLRAGKKIDAIAIVRRATNVGLRDAVDFLEELKRQLDLPELKYNHDETIFADVVAIGSYREDLAQYLNYPPSFFANTREGANVVGFLFEAWGQAEAEGLARCFGIDAWDFNQHKLDPARLDEEMIWDVFFGTDGSANLTDCWNAYMRQLNRFATLRAAGFDFYFWIHKP